VQLELRIRAAAYALVAALFVTGGTWWMLDWVGALAVGSAWRQTGAYLLMVHGGASMLFLLLLGALIPLHIGVAWPSRRNRKTGLITLAATGVLVATAFGLYYVGHEALRRWTGVVHATVGFALPAALAAHVLIGRRRRAEQPELLLSHGERGPRRRPLGRDGRRLVGSGRRGH